LVNQFTASAEVSTLTGSIPADRNDLQSQPAIMGPIPATSEPRRTSLHSIQCLRAIAAWLVVYHLVMQDYFSFESYQFTASLIGLVCQAL
jgi:hypothetical protein